jgi:O-antigen ligase
MNAVLNATKFFTFLLILALPNLSGEGGLEIAGMSLVKITAPIALGFSIILILLGRPIRFVTDFNVASLLYISWVIFSYVWAVMPGSYDTNQAVDPIQAINNNFYILLVSWLLLQLIETETDLKWSAFAYVLGAAWLIYLAITSYQTGITVERVDIKGHDPNELSVKVALALPLMIYLMINAQAKFYWIIGWVFVPFAIFSILITASRTGAIVLVLGLLSFWVLPQRLGVWAKSIMLILAIASLIIIASFVSPAAVERLLSTGSELSEGTLNERSIIWQYAFEVWQQHPIVGQGIGSFRRIINEYNVNLTAHNSFIGIAVEQGIIGLLFYLAVLLVIAQYVIRLPSALKTLLSLLLGIVILGQMSMTLQDRLYIWFIYTWSVLVFYVNNPVPNSYSWLLQQHNSARLTTV